MHRWTHWIVGLLLLTASEASDACPFCAKMGRTLSDHVAVADWVALGVVAKGGAEMSVETVIKGHPRVAATGRVEFAAPVAQAAPEKRIVFARVDQSTGKVRPIRATGFGPKTVEYFTELASPMSRSERIAFHFQRLNDDDPAVRDDAYKSLSKWSAAELAEHASAFDRKKLRRWISDPRHAGERIGLFGLLLGMIGDSADADWLADLARSKKPREMAGRDGFLGGLAVLDRDRAESTAIAQLSDANEPLSGRQAALNAVQFMLDELPRRDSTALLQGLTSALKPPDLRDAVIDLLRLKNAGFAAAAVVSAGVPSFGKPSKALVRYALVSPHPDAVQFVKRLQKEDAALVQESENDLRIESRTRLEPPSRLRERPQKALLRSSEPPPQN